MSDDNFNKEKLEQELTYGRMLQNALDNGDDKEAMRLVGLIKLSPSIAKAIKTVYGLEELKALGYDLSDVIEEFGKEWLEVEEERYLRNKGGYEAFQREEELLKEDGKI